MFSLNMRSFIDGNITLTFTFLPPFAPG